jgi:hypothetical protein
MQLKLKPQNMQKYAAQTKTKKNMKNYAVKTQKYAEICSSN